MTSPIGSSYSSAEIKAMIQSFENSMQQMEQTQVKDTMTYGPQGDGNPQS